MSGLSYFEDGGEVDTSTQESGLPGVETKPVVGKGRYAVATPVGNVPMNQGVLDAMEALYRQKQEQQGSFMEAMKDAAAWASGGIHGPTQGLATRAREKEAQAADLFQIQTQLAQFKAAQEAAKNFQQGLGYGATPVKGTTAPTTGGAAPKWQEMIQSLPENMQPQAMDALRRGDSKVWNALFEKVGMETVKGLANPASAEAKYDIYILNEKGEPELHQVSLPMKQRLIKEGKGFEPGAEIPSKTAPTAGTLTPQEAALPSGQMRTAPAMPANFTFAELNPAQREKLSAGMGKLGLIRDATEHESAAAVFDKMPVEKRKQVFASLNEEMPAAAAPAAAPATPLRLPPVSKIKAEQEIKKKEAEADIEVGKKDFEAFQAATRPADVIDRMNTAKEVIDLVGKNRNAIGVFQRPGFASALGTILETGIKAPGGHAISIGDISSAMVKADPNMSKNEVVARDRIESLLTKTALYASSVIKGQGQITEFERKLIEEMVGSVRNSPENLIKIQKTMLARAKYDEAMGEAFRSSGQSYRDFTRTNPEYKRIYNQFKADVDAIRNEPLESQINIPKQGTTPGGIKWRIVPSQGERK